MKTTALFVAAVATALAAALSGVFLAMHGSTEGWLPFTVWRMISREAHGGHYASVNGVRIYYETYGSGNPVLVLHGGTGYLEDLSYQIQALAATRLVIAVDSRGHGRSSDSDAPLSYSLMADDMLKLLDHLHVLRTDIVGWSDGGIIALDLAMNHPERVRRVVAIGSNFDVDGLIEPTLPGEATPPIPDGYAHIAADPAHWPVLFRKVTTMWATQPHYTQAQLQGIRAPTLVMAGESDVVKREHTDELARAIPHSREYVVEGTTHGAIREEPAIVNAQITEFLDEGATP
jgi:pimeloyl-ACP methyl ester carboxylesterase